MQERVAPPHPRPGYSFLEVQVAFVLLGIALSGLVPLIVMQSKQLRHVEARFRDGTEHHLAPSPSEWASKLGAAASVATPDAKLRLPSVTGDVVHDIDVLSMEKSLVQETVQVRVRAARKKTVQ